MAVGTDSVIHGHGEAAVKASRGVGIPKRSPAGETGSFSQRVRCSTMLTGDSAQPLGQRLGGAKSRYGPVDYLPDPFAELNIFDILGKIV